MVDPFHTVSFSLAVSSAWVAPAPTLEITYRTHLNRRLRSSARYRFEIDTEGNSLRKVRAKRARGFLNEPVSTRHRGAGGEAGDRSTPPVAF